MNEKPAKLKAVDLAPGTLFVIIEAMDNETRWTHYQRLGGVASFSPNYICVARLRTVQGVPGERPRYDSGVRRTVSQMDGRYPVSLDIPDHDAHRDAGWAQQVNAEMAEGALDAIQRLLDDGGIPRGAFADDQVGNLVALYNQRGDIIRSLWERLTTMSNGVVVSERPGVWLVDLPDGRSFGIAKDSDKVWRSDVGGLDALLGAGSEPHK